MHDPPPGSIGQEKTEQQGTYACFSAVCLRDWTSSGKTICTHTSQRSSGQPVRPQNPSRGRLRGHKPRSSHTSPHNVWLRSSENTSTAHRFEANPLCQTLALYILDTEHNNFDSSRLTSLLPPCSGNSTRIKPFFKSAFPNFRPRMILHFFKSEFSNFRPHVILRHSSLLPQPRPQLQLCHRNAPQAAEMDPLLSTPSLLNPSLVKPHADVGSILLPHTHRRWKLPHVHLRHSCLLPKSFEMHLPLATSDRHSMTVILRS